MSTIRINCKNNGLSGENKKLEMSIPGSVLSSRKTDLNVIVNVVVFKTKKPKINLYRNRRHCRWLSWVDCSGLGRFSANCVFCHVLHRNSLQIENRLLMIWGHKYFCCHVRESVISHNDSGQFGTSQRTWNSSWQQSFSRKQSVISMQPFLDA